MILQPCHCISWLDAQTKPIGSYNLLTVFTLSLGYLAAPQLQSDGCQMFASIAAHMKDVLSLIVISCESPLVGSEDWHKSATAISYCCY